MTTAARKKRAGRPAWWPKQVTDAEWRELEQENGGLCLSCGQLVFGDCEPDMRDGSCEACDENRVHGAEEARLMGALVVLGEPAEGSGSREQGAGSGEERKEPAAPPAGTVRARGRLRHRFHGEYSAAMALEFESQADAVAALGVLGVPWTKSPAPTVLLAVVDSATLNLEKTRLGSMGADEKAIDSVAHSVDYGDPFTVDVPVGGMR